MPSIQSFTITTGVTTLNQLNTFLESVGNTAHLHAKIQKDGTYLLYKSKGTGTRFIRTLFPEIIEHRRLCARTAILEVRKSGQKTNASIRLGNKMREGSLAEAGDKLAPLLAGSIKEAVSDAVDAGVRRDLDTLNLRFDENGGPILGPNFLNLDQNTEDALNRIATIAAAVPERLTNFEAFASLAGIEDKMSALLKAGLDGSNAEIQAAAKELFPMREELAKAYVHEELFTNENIVDSFKQKNPFGRGPLYKPDEQMRAFGKDLSTVCDHFEKRDGPYRAALHLAELAWESPEKFAFNLRQCPGFQLQRNISSANSGIEELNTLLSDFDENFWPQLTNAIFRSNINSAAFNFIETPYFNDPTLERPPLESDDPFDTLLDLSAKFGERSNQYLEAILEMGKNGREKDLIELSERMIKELATLKFGSELFTNEAFISKLSDKDKETVRRFGEHLSELYTVLSKPESGAYSGLFRLLSLAINAPKVFASPLVQHSRDTSESSEDASRQLI